MQTLFQIVFGFVVFFILFTVIEKVFPAIKTKPIFRQGYRLDLAYWVLAPTLNVLIKKICVFAVIILVALVLGLELNQNIVKGFGPVAQQPPGLLVLEIVFLGDLIGYWTHRWFHQASLWKIHAIHHSSTELDWLSSVRVHPLNQAIGNSISVAIMLALGFPLTLLAAYLPFLIIYAVLLHANVSWSFGPLRYVIASPAFHRWHHTSESQGLDKNFAGLFPLFDIVFGTFYLPKDKQPSEFGVLDNDIPETLLGQLLYPFRRKKQPADL